MQQLLPPNPMPQHLPNPMQQLLQEIMQQHLPNPMQQLLPNPMQEELPHPWLQHLPDPLQQHLPNPMLQHLPQPVQQHWPNLMQHPLQLNQPSPARSLDDLLQVSNEKCFSYELYSKHKHKIIVEGKYDFYFMKYYV